MTIQKKKNRINHQRCSVKTIILKNFAKNLVLEWACNFLKKRLRHRRIPVNIGKLLRANILKNTF